MVKIKNQKIHKQAFTEALFIIGKMKYSKSSSIGQCAILLGSNMGLEYGTTKSDKYEGLYQRKVRYNNNKI